MYVRTWATPTLSPHYNAHAGSRPIRISKQCLHRTQCACTFSHRMTVRDHYALIFPQGAFIAPNEVMDLYVYTFWGFSRYVCHSRGERKSRRERLWCSLGCGRNPRGGCQKETLTKSQARAATSICPTPPCPRFHTPSIHMKQPKGCCRVECQHLLPRSHRKLLIKMTSRVP